MECSSKHLQILVDNRFSFLMLVHSFIKARIDPELTSVVGKRDGKRMPIVYLYLLFV